MTTCALAELIKGSVVSANSGKPIISATVRLLGTDKGTYADRDGSFKLPGVRLGDKLKISSIGYESKTIEIKSLDYLTIKLKEEDVQMSEAFVRGDIDVRTIIERAIQHKDANQKSIKTVEKTLFSKLKIKLGGGAFDTEETVPGLEDETTKKEFLKNIIAETYSKSYTDNEKNIQKDIILKRRNTANLETEKNMLSISRFINFYQDEISGNSVTFTSPLSDDALDQYEYKLQSRELFDGKYIYAIEFKSVSSVYPGFTGLMNILEGTYELVYIKAKPVSSDLIPNITELEFEEKFEKIDSLYWYPTMLNTKGRLEISLIAGSPMLTADASARSIVENIQINKPLPDSIYNSTAETRVSVAKTVDSSANSFWKDSSLFASSSEDLQIYSKADSLGKIVEKKDSIENSGIDLSFMPYVRINRVDGLTLGASPTINFSRYFKPTLFGAYTLSAERWYFGASAESQLLEQLTANVQFERNTYPLSANNNSDILLSSLTSLFFTEDYYDWYLADRFLGTLSYDMGGLTLSATYQNELISNVPNINPKLSKHSTWRENRVIDEGRFEQIGLNFNLERGGESKASGWDYGVSASSIFGTDQSDNSYTLLFGELSASVPLFETGFEPANIFAIVRAGTSNKAPKHLLYRMNTKIVAFKLRGKFLSPNYNQYGGAEFLELHTGLDLTDFFWRLAGLPKYNWRGLGLELDYSTAYFETGDNPLYEGTEDKSYSEVGFNITKIPSFISPMVNFELGFRWGIGSIGKGNFGAGLNLIVPLFD